MIRLIIWLTLLFCIGFFVFITRIPAVPKALPLSSETIVIVTGGTGRLEAGANLWRKNVAPLVFISGVNPDVKRSELIALLKMDPDIAERHVFLGYRARTTRENGEEVAKWLHDRHIQRAVLVTNDYHLPRALAEIERSVPDVIWQGYAVPSTEMSQDVWYATVFFEYCKYLVVIAGSFI
jgi:uncharacterized SAM-binding protein YcdF (DUF218 family)